MSTLLSFQGRQRGSPNKSLLVLWTDARVKNTYEGCVFYFTGSNHFRANQLDKFVHGRSAL